MTIRKTLGIIALATTIGLFGCNDKEIVKPVERINGTIIKESFYKGNPKSFTSVEVPDEYHAIVECDDNHTRLNIIKGNAIAKRHDTLYDVGSRISLPKEGDNVYLIE